MNALLHGGMAFRAAEMAFLRGGYGFWATDLGFLRGGDDCRAAKCASSMEEWLFARRIYARAVEAAGGKVGQFSKLSLGPLLESTLALIWRGFDRLETGLTLLCFARGMA